MVMAMNEPPPKHRFFAPNLTEGQVTLAGAEAHHAPVSYTHLRAHET